MATRTDPLADLLFEMEEHHDVETRAKAIRAAIRSALRAAFPGRQKGKNLDPLVVAGEKAFLRTLRRRNLA